MSMEKLHEALTEIAANATFTPETLYLKRRRRYE